MIFNRCHHSAVHKKGVNRPKLVRRKLWASTLFLLITMLVTVADSSSGTNSAPALKSATTGVDLVKKRIAMLKEQPFSVDAIFDGATFPKIDFLNRDLVEAAVGPYTVKTRFFDAQWNEVKTPNAPGRYGALIVIATGNGVSLTRHLTLFKTARPYSWAKEPYDVAIKFPAAFGLSEQTLAQEKWNISDWAGGTLDDATTLSDWAVLVAGLHDLAADPARNRGFDVWKINDDWWAKLGKRQGENQDYPYLTYLPEGYDKDKKTWPLILFLHGSGERGADLNKVKNQGPLGYINQGHPLPFIVITPQCPEDEAWVAERLARLLDQVEAVDRVDPKRIYVTGLSLGGFGSFDFAATYPARIAAIAPLSGGEDPDLAERLKTMPTWIFHGAEDDRVPPRYSVDLAHAMQQLGAPVKLTIYPGIGHGHWADTYSNPALYSWFLAQSK